MKNKKTLFEKVIIIIAYIISIIAILGAIYLIINIVKYSNLKLKDLILILITLIISGIILYKVIKREEQKQELLVKSFILDIYSKTNDTEHIRITKEHVLYKYKLSTRTIHRLGIPIGIVPVYKIIGKMQLSKEDVGCIIDEINKLPNDILNNVLINLNGNKKLVNSMDVNRIFKKYNISL